MNVSILSQIAYENKYNWTLGENEPNTNPIKPNTNPIKPKTNPIKPNLKNAQAAVAYDRKAEQLFGHFAEVVKAQLRPGLESISELVQLGGTHKGHLGYHLLSLADLWGIQNPVVHNSEVHTSDLVGIVIEQSNNAVSVVRFYGNLLGYFSLNGGEVHLAEIPIEQGHFIINGVYMASYAD